MARKIKIDNAQQKRFERDVRKRSVGVLPLRKYFLIVCEGLETEPNYFESIKKQLPRGVLRAITITGEGKSTGTLIDKAIRKRKYLEQQHGRKFDQTWVVFDKDSVPDEQFNHAIQNGLKQRPAIHCAWSNEAFELWFLLHFESVQTALNRKDYIPKIEQALSKQSGSSFLYAKNRTDMYELLQQYGDEQAAMHRAEQLDKGYVDQNFSAHNPNTTLYILVGELNKLKTT